MGEWSVSRPGRALAPGKDPRYPLDRKLGGPQSRSGHRGQSKNLLPLLGIEADRPVVQFVVRHYWLSYTIFHITRNLTVVYCHLSFTLTCQSCLGLYNRPRWSSGNVLATGPKVRGFKPGRGQWIFKGDKIRSTTSFGGEVKPSLPCRKILRHVKDPYR
jgi:hypothetical protein